MWGVNSPPIKGWCNRLSQGLDPNTKTRQTCKPDNQYWKVRKTSPRLAVGTIFAGFSRTVGRGVLQDEARIREMRLYGR